MCIAENQYTCTHIHMYFATEVWSWYSKPDSKSLETKIMQYGHQAAILKESLLIVNRLLPIYASIVLLKFGVDIQSWT